MRIGPLNLYLCLALFTAALLAPTGCDRSATPPGGQAGDLPDAEPVEGSPIRIVSLAPAITQMLVDMGQRPLIVGVAENDAAVPTGVEVVGNFQDVNTEKLLKVNPTHVLMMAAKEGPPARLQEMAAKGDFVLVAYPYPQSVSDVSRVLFNEEELSSTQGPSAAPPSLGTVLAARPEAAQANLNMLMLLAQVNDATADAPKPKVLMVIGTGPVMASGDKTVLDQLLGFTGAVNAAEGSEVPAPTFDREKLLAAAPDVVLLMLPGGPPLKTAEEDERLADLRGLDIPAVKNGRIHLISDPLAVLPSSSMGRVATAMAKAIHPDLASRIDRAVSETATQPTTRPAPTTAPTDARPTPEPAAR